MIPHSLPTWQSQTWQQQLADTIRDPAELCQLLQLDPVAFANAHLALDDSNYRQFPLRVPKALINRIAPGDLKDPVLLQVLPQAQEVIEQTGFVQDPLRENQASPNPGFIHKYRGRVLLLLTGACAIHCRYCFRRHFPYNQHRQSREDWQQNLDYLRRDTSINEVIYSGGDPLALSDDHLAWLSAEIAGIPHIDTLRIHTRLPVVIPDRIDKHCLAWLQQSRLKVVMVLHCNHPNEINDDVGKAIAKVRALGITVLNQAVLLKNVNDTLETQIGLSKNLFKIGVLPYYLHLLDRVAGAHHFLVDDSHAKGLHTSLKDCLPGYLVPKLVREVPEAAAKQVIG